MTAPHRSLAFLLGLALTTALAQTPAPAATAKIDPAAVNYARGLQAYEDGKYELAYRLLRPFADKGDTEAEMRVGLMLGDAATYRVKTDLAQALTFTRRAAEKGNPAAQNNYGYALREGQGTAVNAPEAFKWFIKAANQGISEAMVSAGTMLRDGVGIEKNNAEAKKWFLKAAEAGNVKGELKLGLWFLDESGAGNAAEAYRWLRKAAQHDNLRAMAMLGWMLQTGKGTAKNQAEANAWLARAATAGDDLAAYYFGLNHFNGVGLPRNTALARKWLEAAAKQGNADALDALAQMKNK
jgi:uncharacterized protein